MGDASAERAFAPPCLPMGVHRYVIQVFALDLPKLNPKSADPVGILAAMKGHKLAFGERVGRF